MKKIQIAIIWVALLILPHGVNAENMTPHRTVSVSSSSSVTVPAENATIHAQLKVVSESVENSYNQVMKKLVDLTGRMQQFGLAKADITVSAVTQGAEYIWTANTRKLKGYSASCSLQLKVHDIKDSYKIHNELSAFPELTILRTEYGLEEYTELQAQTLRKALKQARQKAEVMAESLGARIGKVLTITELGNLPIPIARAEAVMKDAAATAPNPINVTTHGEVTVNSSVSTIFELQDLR